MYVARRHREQFFVIVGGNQLYLFLCAVCIRVFDQDRVGHLSNDDLRILMNVSDTIPSYFDSIIMRMPNTCR
jgi:hypothetical protein